MKRIIKRKKNEGITLLELLVTITIFLGLTLSAAPLFREFSGVQSPKREAERLKGVFEFLHHQSKLREEEISFRFESSSYSAKSPTRLFEEGKTKNSLTPTIGSIVFYSSGVVTPKTLYISGESEVCTLTISLRGRVKSVCR